MIRSQIQGRGISDPRVIDALVHTDRAAFVPADQAGFAYEDRPLPMIPGATVSQPYIVALMTEILDIHPDHRVLEIGSGSGYQLAILSRLAAEVFGVEILPELVKYASDRISGLSITNVHIVQGNGWNGLPDKAPFNRIMVTAAAETLPPALVNQLLPGGRMVLPLGKAPRQVLEIIEKSFSGDIVRLVHLSVQFVPLVHEQDVVFRSTGKNFK